ncbi:MAG TPA: TlpA disulfide reductase family protein [Pyrinomonadaceae bacterium]|nr:TlpA disulfide reductase family protein [Pyrinomonadaceae bacterium]
MRKAILALTVLLLGANLLFGQNEQSPLVEKNIEYKNWSFKNLRTGDSTDLRSLAKGKKLVMVVYFAAWCPNWKHDAPIVKRLYDKYRASGFEVVGVSEYDAIDKTKTNLESFKLDFPVVTESEATKDRLTTTHYQIRTAAGDTRKWGSPWYIFLEPSKLEKSGDLLTSKASLVNGELIEPDVDKFIAAKLGGGGAVAQAEKGAKPGEVCDPEDAAAQLKKP